MHVFLATPNHRVLAPSLSLTLTRPYSKIRICTYIQIYSYVAATFWVYVDSSWVALFFDHTGIGIS